MNKPVTRGRLLVVCAILAGLLLGLAITLRSIQASRNDELICQKVNRINNVIVAILERSQKALPHNPYYKQHPELLGAALRENARALREFRGAAC